MSKILLVVHRYYPYPGGSEYYVKNIAEELFERGHDVSVLTSQHQGDINGIKVRDDLNCLVNEKWDLIIVHGADVFIQNVVHENARIINSISPVLYLLIKPSNRVPAMIGLAHHKYLGYSTTADINHLKTNSVLDRGVRVRHGIKKSESTGLKFIRNEGYEVYVSAGGYYPNKGMNELAEAWNKLAPDNFILKLYGYGMPDARPASTDKVIVHYGSEKQEVLNAIANADGYIMNSYEEGFGLVLLEAMMNKTPWYARKGVGAVDDMKYYGVRYNTVEDLIQVHLKPSWYGASRNLQTHKAYDYVMSNHTIKQTADDIEDVLK